MIQKVKIESVARYETKEVNGEKVPYTYSKGKNVGKQFKRISITTDKTGSDKYYANEDPGSRYEGIAEGQSLLLNFTESMSADGGKKFLNFNFPTKEQLAAFALENA